MLQANAAEVKALQLVHAMSNHGESLVDILYPVLQMQRTEQDPHVILVLFQQLDIYGPGELQFLINEVTSQITQVCNSPDALQIVYRGLSLRSLNANFVDKQLHVSRCYP